jgi:hypothetical protein
VLLLVAEDQEVEEVEDLQTAVIQADLVHLGKEMLEEVDFTLREFHLVEQGAVEQELSEEMLELHQMDQGV